MKKKLVVSTLAVSMAAASVASFPFSSTGLAQQLGLVSTASAATVSNATVKEKIKAIYSKLSVTDLVYLNKYKQEVNAIDMNTYKTMFKPVLDKMIDKAKLSDEEVETSLNLFKSVSSVVYDVYANDYSGFNDIRVNTKNVDLLKKLGTAAEAGNFTFDDLLEFSFGTNGVEAELRRLVASKISSGDLKNIDVDSFLDEAITNVLNRRTGDNALTVSKVVYGLGITPGDVKLSLQNLNATIKSAKPAAKQLALAYLSAYPLTVDGGTNPGNSGGGGGGGGVVTTPATPVFTADGSLDVSKLVSVVGDKATLKLVDADMIKAFDALVAANAGKTGLTLTLNLGTINAKTVEVPLSKAIIEAAKARGIANIAITFNGVTITIPVAQFTEAVTLTVSTLADTVFTSVSSLKLASSVYELDLTVGGVPTTTFKQPITIKLPLKNTTGLDKELLSVAKLVYGALQFQGGVVNGEFIIEPRDTFSSYAVVENKVSFSDITAVQKWAGREIEVVAAKGAIEGIGQGKFAPKSNVTRAEFSKMLIRALNLENNSAVQKFTDVSSSAWYAPYVAVAAEKGIINGRGDSKFDPNATITRAEMATMISRALKSIKPDAATSSSSLSQFSDANKIAASLKDGVAFAASNKLVIGNAGKFNPNNTATRAEAAVIIYRTINFK
ncbi:S-layer homology domain-containing protein [Paenibacillus donghaensis]|nr:S-layer homology domain-containing protein [Paenibacillus donghaensis]